MVRINVSLIDHGNTLTRVCAASPPPGGTSSPHNANKDYPPHELAYMHLLHLHPVTHMNTLDEDVSIMSPCTQGDCAEQQ